MEIPKMPKDESCHCGEQVILYILFKNESLLGLCSNCFLGEREFYINNNVMAIIARRGGNKIISKAFPNSDILQNDKQRLRVLNDFISKMLS